MGSEFSYEDIASQEVEKYTYNYLGDEELNGLDCFVVEYDPVDRKSGYKRQIVWMDKAEYRVHKIDFYDRKDALLKTLTYEDYNQYLDKFWRSNRLVMINHQTGKKTELVFADWKFQTGMTERDFEKSALKRTNTSTKNTSKRDQPSALVHARGYTSVAMTTVSAFATSPSDIS